MDLKITANTLILLLPDVISTNYFLKISYEIAQRA